MKLRVEAYIPPPLDYCECRDEKGFVHRVDLVVSGQLGDMTPDQLVGRTVEVGSFTPWVEVGHDVRLLEESHASQQ